MDARAVSALTRDEWQPQFWNVAVVTRVGDDVRVLLRCAGGESLALNGADNLWRLIAMANDALPNSDPRKITLEDVHVLHALVASIEVQDVDLRRLLPHVDALSEKFGALLAER